MASNTEVPTTVTRRLETNDELFTISKAGPVGCEKYATSLHPTVVSVYLIFAAVSAYTIRYLSDRDWSALIAADYALQALATVQLLVHVVTTGKMKGISVGMLQALAMSYGLRLSSTVWLQGYLPVDQTGSWFCQVMDLTSLVCVVQLLQRAYGADRDAQELEADQLPMPALLSACLVIGVVCHADLDQRPLFDALWTAGFLAGCIAPLPQFVVTLTCEGALPLTTHFTAPLTLATGATAAFWRYGCLELAPERVMWCIASAVVVQVTLTVCLLVASTRFARAAAATVGVVTGSHIELGVKAPLFDV
jgi:hypothetical protein